MRRYSDVATKMANHILHMPDQDISKCDDLTKLIMAQIERLDPEPLTDKEENVIHIAITQAYYHLVVAPRNIK